jgi:hypothetical protein
MKNSRTANRLIASFVTILLLATPLLAQQRRSVPKRSAAAPEPAPTFDSLLAADSYKVYCEVRGVGGLIHSPAVNDLLDPVMKLGGPPKEFKMLVKWLGAHGDALGGSRMLVAGWPSRPKLPTVIIAIEFSSPEEAKKFYPELRDFLPKFLPTPTPTPTPEPTPKVSGSPSETQVRAEVTVPIPQAEKEPERLPPYQMKQAGSLVFISDIAFTFRNLRPPGSKGLEEDQNFLLARNRFSSESLFLYFDLKSIEKEEKEQREKWEKEAQKREEAEAANPPKEAETVDEVAAVETVPIDPVLPPSDLPPGEPAVLEATVNSPDSSNGTGTDTTSSDVDMTPAFYSLYGALFGGQSKWPEAVGAALVFENDAYVVRTLILNGAENKSSAIPFVPTFVSGPAITPEAPGVFPADVDLFVSVSLDYPQIYEGMLKAFADSQEMMRKASGPYRGRPVTDIQQMETPFAVYEKKLGLKVKDDLLPLLGSELALALPRKAKKAANEPGSDAPDLKQSSGVATQNNAKAGPNPIVAIGVKDREAVGRLIPKLIESFGLKGANLLAQTERRDGTELVSYAGVFSYAFVGDFLVISPDPADVRHVVDAYLNHQTLSSDSHFRNYTRWQSRQMLGQVYVAPGLVEEYTLGSGSGVALRDKMNEFLTGVNPVIDPLTYSLSNDGLGPLHELHIPKNLLQVLVAGMMVGTSEGAASSNEAVTQSIVRTAANAEATFKATEGNGSYASLEQLAAAGLVSKEMFDKYGYRIEVVASGNKFEITAVPIEYGKTGKISYFIDETQILRGGDHGGGAATLSDEPMN